MRILGISAFYHDSAAAVVVDGDVAAAAQEERFTRKKHDARFPKHAIAYCLDHCGCSLNDFDAVVFYEKPLIKFERLLETYLSFAPRGFQSFRMAMPVWLREKLFQKQMLAKELRKFAPDFDAEKRLLFSEHHLSHAASAFYPSPFQEAAVLTMDGVGEWSTTSLALGQGKSLKVLKEMHFPHSIGLLYSAFTYYLGFKVNSGEYKVMGLAPYGEPKYAQKVFDTIVDLKSDGSFRLDQNFFDYCTGLTMTNSAFSRLFGQPVRDPASELLTQFHMDMAASIQAVTEEVVLRLARSVRAETGQRRLCLAGGVALNCVANGKILREGIFDDIWMQPASGDAGGALGAALVGYHTFFDKPRKLSGSGPDGMHGSYLGPVFTQPAIEAALTAAGAKFTTLRDDELIKATAEALADGKAVGWMQGRMEYGPARTRRALDPGRPALAKHAEDPQPQGQVPRELPPLRALGAARGGRRLVRARHRLALYAAGGPRAPRTAAVHERGRARAIRYRQAQRAALGDPGGDARRLLGPRADRAQGDQPTLSCADLAILGAHRLPGARQHQLQRARRAHRVYAGGCLPLLHGQRDRRADGRQLLSAQGRPGLQAQAQLRGRIRARLINP